MSDFRRASRFGVSDFRQSSSVRARWPLNDGVSAMSDFRWPALVGVSDFRHLASGGGSRAEHGTSAPRAARPGPGPTAQGESAPDADHLRAGRDRARIGLLAGEVLWLHRSLPSF